MKNPREKPDLATLALVSMLAMALVSLPALAGVNVLADDGVQSPETVETGTSETTALDRVAKFLNAPAQSGFTAEQRAAAFDALEEAYATLYDDVESDGVPILQPSEGGECSCKGGEGQPCGSCEANAGTCDGVFEECVTSCEQTGVQCVVCGWCGCWLCGATNYPEYACTAHCSGVGPAGKFDPNDIADLTAITETVGEGDNEGDNDVAQKLQDLFALVESGTGADGQPDSPTVQEILTALAVRRVAGSQLNGDPSDDVAQAWARTLHTYIEWKNAPTPPST